MCSNFFSNEAILRAQLAPGLGEAVRRERKSQRSRKIRRELEAEIGSRKAAKELQALLDSVLRAESLIALRDEHQVSAERTTVLMRWLTEQIAGAVQPAKITPKNVTFVEPKASPAPAQPQERGRPVPLARFVEGLTPLPVRCPRLERIELAVDQSSGLHLLGREADLRDMHVVQVWAREQRELLDQACRPIRIDAHSQPVCHVFTDVPASLADLHRSDLKLHVLTPVAVDDRVAWYCAPLK